MGALPPIFIPPTPTLALATELMRSPIRSPGADAAARAPLGAVERLPLDERSPWWGEHRCRYQFAQRIVAGRLVLDIASGSGFGAQMLAEAGAGAVVGCDMDSTSLGQARAAFPGERISFVAGDGTRLPIRDGSFDVVVSFETLEHIPAGRTFLQELARVLRPGGTLILSTPNRLVTDEYPRNPFHVREYTAPELDEELRAVFASVELHGQLLGPRYRVAPFLPGHDRARSPGDHLRLITWKLANRLPFAYKDRLARSLLGHPFYPAAEDYRIGAPLDEAPVLVAVCGT